MVPMAAESNGAIVIDVTPIPDALHALGKCVTGTSCLNMGATANEYNCT